MGIPTEKWDDLWQGEHAKGFMSAGAQKAELLSGLRDSVQKAIDGKMTLKEFQAGFDNLAATHGWSYKGGRSWRSALIYDTNITTAYQAGRWQQFQEGGTEYLKYVHADGVLHPRPQHVAWNGTVLPIGHDFWKTHYPSNGWRCHCRAVRAERWQATQPPAEWQTINPKTGAPEGIDKGWDFNVGEAAYGRTREKLLLESQGKWLDLNAKGPVDFNRPATIPVDLPRAALGAKEHTSKGLLEALTKAIGGDTASIADPTGERVMVTLAIVDHILEKPDTRWDGREAFFPFIRELVEEPFEVWANFARNEESGRVAIRKKYVKMIRLDKDRVIGLYAESQDGVWVGGDLFRGSASGAKNLRKGQLLYGRD